jgi:hypothetical protein
MQEQSLTLAKEYEETTRSARAKLERKEEGLELAHPPWSEKARIH